jgi:hypothetical protein
MLTQQQIRSFHQDGYLLVPNVLSAEKVKALKEFLRPLFDLPAKERAPGDTDQILFDIYSRHSKLRWLLFHEQTMKVLKDLLGDDYVVLRESSAHRNLFSGWHRDTGRPELQHFNLQKDCLMVQVAYYLQDNIEDVGGGLDVQPGSHLRSDPIVAEAVPASAGKPNLLQSVGLELRNFFLHLSGFLHARLGINTDRVLSFGKQLRVRSLFVPNEPTAISIPSKAGDLVIFDFRVKHRGTQPPLEDAPREREKLAIFLLCSRNNSFVDEYHAYIHSRPDYVYLKQFAYPADLLDQAKAIGLSLV